MLLVISEFTHHLQTWLNVNFRHCIQVSNVHTGIQWVTEEHFERKIQRERESTTTTFIQFIMVRLITTSSNTCGHECTEMYLKTCSSKSVWSAVCVGRFQLNSLLGLTEDNLFMTIIFTSHHNNSYLNQVSLDGETCKNSPYCQCY